MKFASLKYDYSQNLGDNIQSLAAEQFLPRVDTFLNRDHLKNVQLSEPHLLILNGWFSHFPEHCFPPDPHIVPVFWGFHISAHSQQKVLKAFLQGESLAYLQAHQPIGCRDRGTVQILRQAGIQAFYSQCLTLTFPRRQSPPKEGKIFIVDIHRLSIPERYQPQIRFLSHRAEDADGPQLKRQQAQRLLQRYREEAHLVITSRLHCALPCIAMGIPVIFVGDPNNYRLSILQDLGLPIYPPEMLEHNYRNLNWNPAPLPFEKQKARLIKGLQEKLNQKLMSPP